MLVKAWHTTMSFQDFCDNVFELYGPDRKHLLLGKCVSSGNLFYVFFFVFFFEAYINSSQWSLYFTTLYFKNTLDQRPLHLVPKYHRA